MQCQLAVKANARFSQAPSVAKRVSVLSEPSRLRVMAVKSTDPDTKKVSAGEVVQMFREAQKNIMELNQQRLKAMEELKAARSRIESLETELTEAKSLNESLSGQMGSLRLEKERAEQMARDAFARPGVMAAPMPVSASAPPAGAAPLPAATATITLLYETGWTKCYMHFNADKKGWTTVPGVLMGEKVEGYPGHKAISVPAGSVEFVVTNGDGKWDTPDPYSGGKSNYEIHGAGRYILARGKITRV